MKGKHENDVRTLSLWQPWASLMAAGAKSVETRSWSTEVRGPVAIHAAKTQTGIEQLKRHATDHTIALYAYILRTPLNKWHELPAGRIVAMGDLVDCLPTSELRTSMSGQIAYGNFEPGRYGLVFENLRAVESEPVVGCQRFFWTPKSLILPQEVDCPVCEGTAKSKVTGQPCSLCKTTGKITAERAALLSSIKEDIGERLQ